MHEGSKVERAAVVSDVRGGEYFEALQRRARRASTATASRHRVLFLDADDRRLLNRYKETRRRHPLAPDGSVAQGIAAERALLERDQGARRRRDRLDRAEGVDAAAQDRRRVPAAPAADAARGDVPELRLQARPAARRRPGFDVRFLPNPH